MSEGKADWERIEEWANQQPTSDFPHHYARAILEVRDLLYPRIEGVEGDVKELRREIEDLKWRVDANRIDEVERNRSAVREIEDLKADVRNIINHIEYHTSLRHTEEHGIDPKGYSIEGKTSGATGTVKTEIAPCPHCGTVEAVEEQTDYKMRPTDPESPHVRMYFIICPTCRMRGPESNDPGKARSDWKSLPQKNVIDKLDAENERLAEENAELVRKHRCILKAEDMATKLLAEYEGIRERLQEWRDEIGEGARGTWCNVRGRIEEILKGAS